MNDKDKAQVIDSVFKLAQKARKGDLVNIKAKRKEIYEIEDSEHGYLQFCLVDDSINDYLALKKFLVKKIPGSDKFTTETIESIAGDLLCIALFTKSKDSVLSFLNSKCRYIQNYDLKTSVLIPIDGINIEHELVIGEVVFKQIYREDYLKIIGVHEDEDQSWLFAEFSAVAEQSRCLEMAIDSVEQALEVLRHCLAYIDINNVNNFLGKYIYGRRRIYVGVKGQTVSSFSSFPVITNYGNNKSGVLICRKNRGDLPVETDLNSVLVACGADKIVDIMSRNIKGSVTNLERSIFRSVHWFSIAENQLLNENRLLGYITYLELFFSSQYGSSLTQKISEGCAFVLATDKEKRKEIKKQIADLYKKRGSITHGGSNQASDSDIEDLRALAHLFIQNMIKYSADLKTVDDFLLWIEDQKFG